MTRKPAFEVIMPTVEANCKMLSKSFKRKCMFMVLYYNSRDRDCGLWTVGFVVFKICINFKPY